ncbi:MAG TPA: cysteine--tRNA ligase [Bacteroidia bacterium]|jgi:cysteinyl-tRNA synthetase|nr:cysteine--tRNA ligase [Bacteroidia bacterium]
MSEQKLFIQNTLTRKKELFTPLNPPFVGMYVCGPTLYSDVHIGNCRTFTSFDIMYRYLTYIGYNVRYVRNITDVGHLVDEDAGEGEDRIARQARLKKLEPMEIVQRYSFGFREVMSLLNLLPPSIEPTASGHIIEQIEMTEKIIKEGYAYEKDGTVWFDVEKFAKKNNYGILSGRSIEDQMNNTRELDGQEEKRGRLDFALWKKAKPEHIMRWNSPWGEGFPGWHIECSAMSRKYLGETFDIHGGGMDLIPTHHTNEIAQSVGCCGHAPVRYWIHTNMLTLNGQKMSRSLGNVFLPVELFTGMKLAADSPSATPSQAKLDGKHPLFEKGYSPMTVRFFMLQTHYSSTLDFSNEALQASEKGFRKLMEAIRVLEKLKPSAKSSVDVAAIEKNCYDAMNDDFNTPILLAQLFDTVKYINSVNDGKETISENDLGLLRKTMHGFVFDVLGLKDDIRENAGDTTEGLMQLIIRMRADARNKKDFATSDLVRDELAKLHIVLKDGKEGTGWEMKS